MLSATGTSARRQLRSLPLIVLALFGVGLLITVVVLRHFGSKVIPRTVEFDTRACVRMLNVSKVYVIRANPHDTDEVWFGSAEGVRVLNDWDGVWTRYGYDHGLGSEVISDIAFAGPVAWIATWGGLYRFNRDSSRFDGLAGAHGSGSFRILSVEYMPGQGLFYYVDGKGLHFLADGATESSPVLVPGASLTSRISCLRAFNDTLCIGMEGARLVLYRPADSSFYDCVYEGRPNPQTFIWDVVRHSGNYYVATSNEGVWKAASFADTMRFINGFPAKGAYAFVQADGGLWCGTPFGLWRYETSSDVWIQFKHPDEREPTDFQVFALERSGSKLWYGSMELGAGWLDTRRISWNRLRAGFSAPNIAALASDDTLLWAGFGYMGGYLDRLKAGPLQFGRNYDSRDSILDSHVQSLLLHDGRVYYGTYRGFGYIDLERANRMFYLADTSMPHGDVAAIAVTGKNILLATLFGVVKYAPATGAFTVLPGIAPKRVTSLYPQGDTLWFGALGDGVFRYDMRSGVETRIGLQGIDRVMALGPMPGIEGKLAVVMRRDGCQAIDMVTGIIEPVTVPPGLIGKEYAAYDREVTAAAFIDGRLWMGTRKAGCIVLGPGLTWASISYYDGLPSDEVRSIAGSAGYVWIGCYGGLCRFDKSYLETRFFKG